MILLDGRPLQGPSAVRGIGSYARGLLAGFAEQQPAPRIELLLAAHQPTPAARDACGATDSGARLPTLHPTLQPLADPFLVAAATARVRPALYHALEWGQPIWAHCPVVVTVHDLIPFVFPDDYPWVRRARIPALHLLKRATRVIAPSRATARDVVRLGRMDPTRISVVPEGIDAAFTTADPEQVKRALDALGVRRPFLLTVGTFDPRKRIDVLARAFARVRRSRDIDLVIAGDQGTFAPVVRSALAGAGVAERSHVTGQVSVDALVALYSGAECFVFSSAYEGFGLPPLEAMACGTPVVMFANSSLLEIAGPSVLVRPDGDGDAFATAVLTLLSDEADRAKRVDAGRTWAARFTWRAAAGETLAAYERAQSQ